MPSVFAAPPELKSPPVAPKREVVDQYFGTKIADPYRYMENLKDPEVVGWLKAESAYAHEYIDVNPGRQKLLERIKALDHGAPYTISEMFRLQGGALFYKKLVAGAETGVVCVRPSIEGEERVVLEPKGYESGDGRHASMEFYTPSPDGKYVLAGISKGGSEITTIYVRDVATGKDLPDVIDRIETAYNIPQWMPDSRGFYYVRRQKLPPGAPASQTYDFTVCYAHQLGQDPDKDTPVFGRNLAEGVVFAAMDFPSVTLFPDGKYAIGQIHHGDSQELTLYSTALEALLAGKPAWKKICTPEDGVNAYEADETSVYLVSAKDAPRYRVLRTPLADPDFAHAAVVLPESDLIPGSVHAAKGHLFVNAAENGVPTVIQLDPAGTAAPVALAPPEKLSGSVSSASPYFADVFVSTESWTKDGGLYSYDPAKGAFTESALQPTGAFDNVPGYASKEVMVKSHDGVEVPLSIIYKEDVKLDGTHPLLLNAYGAYGISMKMRFSPVSLAWLERGGILAWAHVRGGGERGKLWHSGGQKATKPNTWKDLIACAEYLIAEKYTSTPKLAIQGGSAGGITMGRTITERPDLFQAAIINVGISDMLRFETTENGPPNVQEYGSVATEAGFKALLEMSPFHHVKDGVKYPAVLLTHGLNDRRVDAWMSGKMTARLQTATTSGKPVMLLLDTDAGHGIGSTRSQLQEQTASKWSFLLWQMGDPDFQPAVK